MKKRWGIGIILFVLTLGLQWLARTVPGFAQGYVSIVYPMLTGTVGRICGLFPFSVAEFGFYGLILFCIIYGIRNVKKIGKLISSAFLLVSVLLLVYTLNCGINYYRLPFSSYLDFTVEKSSVRELKELCDYLTAEVNAAVSGKDTPQSKGKTGRQGVAAMKRLGQQYPQLAGFYPQPKAVFVSQILSFQHLSGIYLPFTIEANYNRHMPEYNIPLTICHELSHLKGFMREEEANFIGYLACVGSESPSFQYSGYLLGWIYATNALADADHEAYLELFQQLDSRIVEDLQENSRFWSRYDGKIAEVSNQMNDTYLKINSQEDGVQSYGRIVDLMLAYYKAYGYCNLPA